jgi:hypothetical protein
MKKNNSNISGYAAIKLEKGNTAFTGTMVTCPTQVNLQEGHVVAKIVAARKNCLSIKAGKVKINPSFPGQVQRTFTKAEFQRKFFKEEKPKKQTKK